MVKSQKPLHSGAHRFGAQLVWHVGSITGPELAHWAVILPYGKSCVSAACLKLLMEDVIATVGGIGTGRIPAPMQGSTPAMAVA
jgi:hypothetical protein